MIADTYVAQRAGDAHTLMTASPTLLTNHIAGRSKLNYTDFTPVALLFDEYIAFVVRPESPFKTGNELIAALKKNPASENQRGQHELPICYGERSANCLRRLDQPNIQFSPDSLGVTTQRCE